VCLFPNEKKLKYIIFDALWICDFLKLFSNNTCLFIYYVLNKYVSIDRKEKRNGQLFPIE